MNDGSYNWCTQHSAWGSWISGLEHTAKLICFVKDGSRGEGRLLSFRQERSTWCQERRRCSSCCLCCHPTAPPPHSHTPPLSSPKTLEHTHQPIPACICACACTHKHTHHKHSTYSDSTKLERCLDSRPRPHAEPRPLCHHATLILLPGIKKKERNLNILLKHTKPLLMSPCTLMSNFGHNLSECVSVPDWEEPVTKPNPTGLSLELKVLSCKGAVKLWPLQCEF